MEIADEEREAVVQARRRDSELTSGAVVGRLHEEVMQAALRDLASRQKTAR